MIEPELKTELEKIDQHLVELQKKTGRPSLWRSFFGGIMSALGYVVGFAIVLVLLGWTLQKTGLLPAFKEQVKTFSEFMDQAKRFTVPENSNQQNTNGQ